MTEARTLAVRQRDGVVEYEQHMQAVQRGDLVLRLPRNIRHAGALGRSVAFTQLIATWANACSERHIHTTLAANDHDHIERFVSRLHGLAAAYYANQIIANDGKTDLRRLLLEAAAPRIRAMSDREFKVVAKGPLTELIFLHGATRQFHSAAYYHEPTQPDIMDPERHGKLIVRPREMNALVRNILFFKGLHRNDAKRIVPLLNRDDSPLGTLLHEAFRNTAEHAYLNLNRKIPPRGLRCILISTHSINPSEIRPQSLVSADHPELETYFAQLRDRATLGRRRLIHILELSVLDTGPGFTATIAPHVEPNTTDQHRVAQCFVDHVSSKRGPNSGLGLGRVLSHVGALGGFLRLRTSSTEAFFSSLSHKSGTYPDPHIAGDLPNATGTALTIAVPLEV